MSNFPYFIIEHIEDEFPKDGWCAIEYSNILRIVTPQRLIITNISPAHQANLPSDFNKCAAISSKSLIEFLEGKASNTDVNENEVLRKIGTSACTKGAVGETRVCFLDEQGTGPLAPADINHFDYIIVGGILGDHPPRDKGGHLRGLGFAVRHLGPRQMSTDTAVLACATVLRHQVNIEDLLYHDDPEVYQDEIDCVPRDPMTVSGCRESTAVRMRYLAHQQPKLSEPAHQPIDLIEELPPHLGHWELCKTEKQRLLSNAAVNTPRITPGLLEHIFDSMNDGLFDFDGALDVLDEEVDEEEKQALNATLFDF